MNIMFSKNKIKNFIAKISFTSGVCEGLLARQKFLKILNAQIPKYSYCCYLGKIKFRTIVEETCDWDIYLDTINRILGFSCKISLCGVLPYHSFVHCSIDQHHGPDLGGGCPPQVPTLGAYVRC